jgi:hypothetical protein
LAQPNAFRRALKNTTPLTNSQTAGGTGTEDDGTKGR